MKLDLVDVFGSRPLKGNPLAVVHGGESLSGEAMQALARWLGFSETAFLLPPGDPAADYRVRIFTTLAELPFAGHPTLGSCHAWLAAGGSPKRIDRTVQECGVGLVEVRQDGDLLAFKAPPLVRSGPLSDDERRSAGQMAGVAPGVVVEAVHIWNGPEWQLLRLRSAANVLAAQPAMRGDGFIGLAGPHGAAGEADWEVRAFVPSGSGQRVEDPVTGSLNAGVAMHLFASGLAQGSYTAAQGRKTGADGRVHCTIDGDGAVWVGGKVATIAGGAELPGWYKSGGW